MKYLKLFLLAICIGLLLTNCGPNSEQINAARIADSIKLANIRAEKGKALQDLDNYQKKLAEYSKAINYGNDFLEKMTAKVEVAKDEIEYAKTPQFLRTHEEREQDINNASLNKIKLEKNIGKLKGLLKAYNDSLNSINNSILRIKEFLKN